MGAYYYSGPAARVLGIIHMTHNLEKSPIIIYVLWKRNPVSMSNIWRILSRLTSQFRLEGRPEKNSFLHPEIFEYSHHQETRKAIQ